MVLTAARRRMTDALDTSETVLVVGSSQDARILAERLAEEYDVVFVSERADLVDQSADGIEAHEARLDDGGELTALDLSADAAVVAATRDRTNLFVTQILRTRGEVGRLLVRVNDPERADIFAGLGAETICTTDVLTPEIKSTLDDI